MVEVSVVVPVYNVEDYVGECLESLINQTLKDIEIICINDGSTDDSLKILEEYSKKDNRIKVFSQENSGLSATRNNGIQVAEGNYIYFIDADDFLELTALEELLKISKKTNCDFIIFKLINFYDNTYEKYTSNYYEMEFLKPFRNKTFHYSDIGEKIFDVAVSTPGKFFKKSLISNLKFPEGLIFEDNFFFAQAVINSDKIYFYDKHLYNRRIRDNSITTTYDIKFADTILIINKIINLIKENNLYDKFKIKLFDKKMISVFARFRMVDEEYQDEFFNLIKSDFKNFEKEYYEDKDFENKADEVSKGIFKNALTLESSKEYLYTIQLLIVNKDIEDIKENNIYLKEEIDNLKEKNESILYSNSWKATKPLRVLMNILR